MDRWKNGLMDRWKNGSIEERGSMEELQDDSMEGRSTERRVTRNEVTSNRHRGINTTVSMKDLGNLVVYYTYIPDPSE